jgi:hypothetical protein
LIDELVILILEAKRPIMKNAIIQFFDNIIYNVEVADSIVTVAEEVISDWKRLVWEKVGISYIYPTPPFNMYLGFSTIYEHQRVDHGS